MSRGPKILLTVLALAAVLVPALIFLPLNAWMLAVVAWVREAGALGVVAFIAIYALSAVLFIPGSVLTLAAGFLFGVIQGFWVVSAASTLGATAAFLLGRTVAREWIAQKLAGRPRFAAVDRAVGGGGLRIVLLLRLSPILPFILLNYAFGLTRVKTREYVLGSWLGMMPGTLLYVYLGSLITSLAELSSGQRPDAGALGQVLLAVGLVAMLLGVVLVTRYARRALDEELRSEAARAKLAEERTP